MAARDGHRKIRPRTARLDQRSLLWSASPRTFLPPTLLARRLFWLALLCIGCAGSAQAALQFQLDDRTGDLTPEEIAASVELFEQSRRILPARWRDALGEVSVQWRGDLPVHVQGRAWNRRIALDRRLLAGWQRRDPGAGLDDPGARAALAAVLHELAHLYDRSPAGRLSRDPRLLDIAGWQVAPLRFGLRGRNAFSDRSPDGYELDSVREFVAVNLELYLLDPDYACRRPALHRYFAAGFANGTDSGETAATASSPSDCPVELVFSQGGEEGESLLALDPARVHAVEYLLAEANERPMSRWGHGMLRLVICAPGRPPGPACRWDLEHHRVLSFRAFVDDVQISSWRGLTGSYPSRLFVLPLSQVIDEYTKVELRGLQSIPLALAPGETAALVERAAQLHWSYDGRYYFLGNNCAVETFKLLHDAVPRLAQARLSSITPTGLLRRLVRAGIADATVLDRPDAVSAGYHFESMDAHYQSMLDVAAAALELPPTRVPEWLALAPEARRPALERAGLRSGAALLLLEHAALRRQEQQVQDELKRRYLGRERRDAAGVLAGVEAYLQLDAQFSRPAAWLDGLSDGYGLPLDEEREILRRIAAERARERDALGEDLRLQARRLSSESRRAALEGTEANLALIGERLRVLSEGGYSLSDH